jgi:hypothetical protein
MLSRAGCTTAGGKNAIAARPPIWRTRTVAWIYWVEK